MDDAAPVRAWLDRRADEMTALLEALVAMDTDNPPGRNLERCARALCDAMEQLGLAAQAIEPCLVRGSVGAGVRTIYYHGHFDVVPAQSPAQFRPQRRGGVVVGRGTADMKGGLVSMLYGAAAARELGLLGDARLVFHLVGDEETGSTVGSRRLRELGLIDSTALAMPTAEPTGGAIWRASRGAITLRVTVTGREAHVGQAHLGVNAFEQLLAIAQPLADLARELRGRNSMLVIGGEAGAGAGFNVVPGSAWFSVDRRFNPDEELERELVRITDTIAAAADGVGADVAVDVLQQAPSASTDIDHPAALALAQCAEAATGETARFDLCPGVLETRWYAELGIPAFAYGPGRLEVSHGPDEHVEEAALRRCAAVYALFPLAVTA